MRLVSETALGAVQARKPKMRSETHPSIQEKRPADDDARKGGPTVPLSVMLARSGLACNKALGPANG